MLRKFLFQSIAVFLSLTVIMSCNQSGDLFDISQDVSDIAPYKWEVISVRTDNSLIPQLAEESYVLELASDGSYNLSLDVNNCEGQYIVPIKGQINLEIPGCSKACCDSEFAEKLPGLISMVTEFYVKNEILTLRADGGITTSIKLKRL